MTTGHDLAVALRGEYLALSRRWRRRPHGARTDRFNLLATLGGWDTLTRRGSTPTLPHEEQP